MSLEESSSCILSRKAHCHVDFGLGTRTNRLLIHAAPVLTGVLTSFQLLAGAFNELENN